jgi:hypothetical protein
MYKIDRRTMKPIRGLLLAPIADKTEKIYGTRFITLSNIIRQTKSTEEGLARHTARMDR